MTLLFSLLVLHVLQPWTANAYFAPTGIVEPSQVDYVGAFGKSQLYTVSAQGYDRPVWLLDMQRSRYEMGYSYGWALGNQTR
jgi:hypothetical protein